MTRATISRQAEADLNEIWAYIAVESPHSADDLLNQIPGLAKLIASQPRMGRMRFDLAPELRSMPVGAYLLFYKPRDGPGVHIIRVLHGRRDISPEVFNAD